jgi:hypothetical protein
VRDELFIVLVRRIEDERRSRAAVLEEIDAGFAKSTVDKIGAGGLITGAPGSDNDTSLTAGRVMNRPSELHLGKELLSDPSVFRIPIILDALLFKCGALFTGQ